MRRVILAVSLWCDQVLDGDVLVVPSFSVAKPKTKEFVKLLGEISPEAKTLIIGKDFDDELREYCERRIRDRRRKFGRLSHSF